MKKSTKSFVAFEKFKLENPKSIFGGLSDNNSNGGPIDPIKSPNGGDGNDRP